MEVLYNVISWIVNKTEKPLAFVGGILVLTIILAVCIPYLRRRLHVPQIVKKNSAAIIGAVVIFVVIFILRLPNILWRSGLFKENELFHNSDTLGYYGALIGGGVTVLGVYWTLNYESKKSVEERSQERELLKEERRKNSLPILRFKFVEWGFSFDTLQQSEQVLIEDEDEIPFKNYHIFIDTTNGSSEYSQNSIHKYGELKIDNIGLGTAIISDVKLVRTNPEKTEVKNIGILKLNQELVSPQERIKLGMCIRSDDLNKEDTLYFTFMDLYSNKYLYKIPFDYLEEDTAHSKTYIFNENVEMFPDLVPTEK